VTWFEGSVRSHILTGFPATLQLLRCGLRGRDCLRRRSPMMGPADRSVKPDGRPGRAGRRAAVAPTQARGPSASARARRRMVWGRRRPVNRPRRTWSRCPVVGRFGPIQPFRPHGSCRATMWRTLGNVGRRRTGRRSPGPPRSFRTDTIECTFRALCARGDARRGMTDPASVRGTVIRQETRTGNDA
jgi:hypothetical protein